MGQSKARRRIPGRWRKACVCRRALRFIARGEGRIGSPWPREHCRNSAYPELTVNGANSWLRPYGGPDVPVGNGLQMQNDHGATVNANANDCQYRSI